MDKLEFDHSTHVLVPLSFLDKLFRCYYGTGARDGEMPVVGTAGVVERPGADLMEFDRIKDMAPHNEMDAYMEAKGAALRKKQEREKKAEVNAD